MSRKATPAQLWDALVHTECCLLLRETELGIRRFKTQGGAFAEAKAIIEEYYGKRPNAAFDAEREEAS